MKISILGGGAWGATLAQILSDNNHEVLIYEKNEKYIESINNHIHPIFKNNLKENIKATNSIEEILSFSDFIQISIPSKYIRGMLEELKPYITRKLNFINTSKGVEISTFKTIEEVTYEVLGDKVKNYASLSGPSHAEDAILRKITFLLAASKSHHFAKKVQNIYTVREYIRVYITSDIIGCELFGSAKNAIAIISGAITALDLGENLRAAVITRGLYEIGNLALSLGGRRHTAYGLSGIGDLIVTALSTKSRNFKCGLLLGQGKKLDDILDQATQTIEGVEAIKAFYKYSEQHNIDMPLIKMAYNVIFLDLPVDKAIKTLLLRDLKREKF